MAARTVEVRITGSTRDLEAALERAGLVADRTGKKIGQTFTEGSSKAGGALAHLSNLGASFGLPFMGSLDNIGKKLDEAHTKTGRFSTALAEAGKVTLAAGAVGFAGAAAEAVNLGEKFQTASASIAASSDISQKAATAIGNAFLGTAGKSIYSGTQLAQAFAAVAGQLKVTEGHALSAAQAVKVMASAEDLAQASREGLTATTAALAQTMQAYHLSVGQASQASDVLFNVSRSLSIPVGQVAQAMARLHGRLGELAPSMSDVAGLLVDLGGKGITGSRGIQVVNTALQTLVGNSKNTRAVLHDLGVSVYDSSGRFIGLQNVIGQLQPKLAGLTQAQQIFVTQTLFGKSAAQVMAQVIGDGVPKFQAATDAATRMGTAHRAAQLQAKTLHDQMEMLKATVVDLGTKFGLFLIPKLQQLGSTIATGIGWLEKHKAAAQALAVVISGVLGVAVAAFAVNKIAQFVGGVSRAVGTLGKWATSAGETATAIGTKLGLISTETQATATKVAAADTQIEATNSTAGASFATMAAEADTAEVGVSSQVASMAAAVEGADANIEAANAAAGRSFMALLGPIGLATSAAFGLQSLLNQTINIPSGSSQSQALKYLESQGLTSGMAQGLVGQLAAKGAFSQASNASSGTFQPGTPLAPTISAIQAANPEFFTGPSAPVKLSLPSGVNAGALNSLMNGTGGSTKHAHVKAPKPVVGNVPGLSASQSAIARQLMQYFTGAGLSAAGAAAIVGNWVQESSLTPGDNGPSGLGMAQWLGSRASGEQAFAASHGLSPFSVAAQAGFAVQELQGMPGLLGMLKTTSDPRAAALAVSQQYERPAAWAANNANREAQAAAVFASLSGGGPGGISAAIGGSGMTLAEQIQQALQKFIDALAKAGDAFATKLDNAIQNGSLKVLEATLGVSTTGRIPVPGGGRGNALPAQLSGGAQFNPAGGFRSTSSVLHRIIEGIAPGASLHRIDTALVPTLTKIAGQSSQGQGFSNLVAELKATHNAGLVKLASELVSAHKAALAALGQELYAAQVTKDAESLTLQATQGRDLVQIASDEAAKQLNVVKDATQLVTDRLTAAATAIKDATQQIQDRFAAMAQAVTNATQLMADSSNAVVQGIQDQTQIQVDILGEKGLYGLNLIAQKEQVQLDILKAGFDQQIAAAQQNLDATKATWDAAVASAQANVDQVQLQQDALTAQAQQTADTVQLVQGIKVAAAQAHVDSVTLAQDVAVQLAQTAVDLSATASKAQQDVVNAQLRKAEGQAAVLIGRAQGTLTKAQSDANAAIGTAQGILAQAQGQAAVAEAYAQAALANAQGQASVAIAQATQAVQSIQDTAAQQEAQAQGKVSVTQAEASTQFAGTGMVVNMYGIPLENATAIVGALDWVARTTLST